MFSLILVLRKPPNCGMDSNFLITALPTFVNQRHQIPFPARARFDQRKAPEIPNERNFWTLRQSLARKERLYDRGKAFR